MSGSLGGLIPTGNGGFINPMTGAFVPPAQAASLVGSLAANPAGSSPAAPATGAAMPNLPLSAPPVSLQPPAQAGAPAANSQPSPVMFDGQSGAQPAPSAPSPAPPPSSGPSDPTTAVLAGLRAKQAALGSQPATTPADSPQAASTPPSGAPAQASGFYPNTMANLATSESGNNPTAANPQSSAKGLYQFTDGTWNDFLQTPQAKAAGYTAQSVTDPNAAKAGALWLAQSNKQAIQQAGFNDVSPGDIVAAHVLGAGDTIAIKRAAATNPNMPLGTVINAADKHANAVFADNPGFLDPKDTVAQFLAKAQNVASTGSWKGGQETASNGASDVPLAGPSQGASSGGDPGSFMSTYHQMLGTLPTPQALPDAPQLQGAPQLLGTNPSGANEALSFASGMLSGHSFGDGLGKGFGNLAQSRQQQMELANAARVQQTAMGNSAAQQNFANNVDLTNTKNQGALNRANAAVSLAKLGIPVPVGYTPVQLPGGGWGYPMRNQLTGQMSTAPLGGAGGSGATPLAIVRNQQQAQNQQGNKDNSDFVGQSVKDLASQRSSVQQGIDNERNIDNVINLMPANGAAIGPSLGAKAIREFVNMTGLPAGDVTPDGLGLTNQGIQDMKMGEMPALKNVFPRGLAGPEIKLLNGMLPDHDMNPQAILQLAQEMKADIARRTATIGMWDKMPPDQQKSVMASPSGFNGWWGQQMQQAYGSTGAQPDPGASISPQGKYTGTAGYLPTATGPNGQKLQLVNGQWQPSK